MTNEVNVTDEQVRESVELLSVQVDALIRRCAAKDDTFAQERRVSRKALLRVEQENRDLKSENRKLKRELAEMKSGGSNAR